MSSIPSAVDNVTLIDAAYLNAIKGAVEDLESGTVPAGGLDIDGLPGPGADPLDGEADSVAFFNASAGALQKIRPNAILKIGSAGAGSLGELVTWNGTDSVALSAGSDGEVLTADSTAPAGLAWGPAGGGGTALASVFDARLTLTTAVPVTTADVTAASTIYLTPYGGNQIALYDGAAWQYHALSEISLALSGLTSGANYDVWVYDNSGTLTLELSAAWTNDTTRTDAVAFQDGVRVKSGATDRRLVGTIRTTGTDTTEDSLVKRFVRNERHPVARKLLYEQGGTTWTYSSSTWRRANNNAAAEVYALASGQDLVQVNYWIRVNQSSAVARIGVGVDSLTPISEAMSWSHEGSYNHIRATSNTYPVEGYHYWPAVESVETTGTAGYAANGYIVGEVRG